MVWGRKYRGGHCEYAAWVFRRLTGIVEVALGHCRTAANGLEQVCCVYEVRGASVGKGLEIGWGRCNNAADGKGSALGIFGFWGHV